MENSITNMICRSCLVQSGDMVNIFDENDDLNNLKFCDEYILCTNIKITTEDCLPKTVCVKCLSELSVAYNFFKRSTDSDKYLRENLKIFFVKEVEDESVCDVPDNYVTDYDAGDHQYVVKEEEIIDEITLETKPVELNETTPPQWKSKRKRIKNKFYFNNPVEICEDKKIKKNKSDNKIQLSENDTKTDIIPLSDLSGKDTNVEDEDDSKERKPFLCNICGKSYAQESTLKTHFLSHTNSGEKPFKCTKCVKTYFTKHGLQTHQQNHSQDKKKPKAKFLCSTCGKGFTTNQRLRIHTYIHTGEKNFPCEICQKKFATEFRLRSHLRTHTGERPYECDMCGLRFAQGNALKCHQRVHTGEKPYECKVCSKRFSQNTILKTHMTLHTGKTVKCPDCDKKFSRASYLILHRREHTGEKPYACDRCPNRYKQKSHLDRHMDVHLGVKHRCKTCGKEYSKQWSLRMHMFTHMDEKPFKCEICFTEFIRKDKYKSHMKTHENQTTVSLDKVIGFQGLEFEVHVTENVEIIEQDELEYVEDQKLEVVENGIDVNN